MDQELLKKLEAQEVKIDSMSKSVEKIRKYFLIMTWITIIAIVLPMIGLVFAVPAFISSYTANLSGLGL